ncbi:peptide/nickel transport system substrate-binding protein/oligopeptide transport system substrate-binding protein [Thermosporothrix hazakensis]|jgi:peptide/nickel transport system substrate-binding protein/oligopeptide transport system substrate-binding protein|uniref:Peptide/nickel transport system substrate-binding protein/oligopeptide transport system substrate-binding protein n=1 Tax=Thermosporothrix hazakensis TaxID=644383 RepID=A0A326U758_THEHA|nr:peptide ABC transporter substrate-binding protein [Thermosporothrix hazakensis]PZW30628.1 peptide/nickel transport system substrate-binding protein/oligopeptide transport system substrate-binding protein [Thermosporothrix hazakensis]GCE49491.1 oligopeptide-binding protein OppA [Thermosporothrix hazakensis]
MLRYKTWARRSFPLLLCFLAVLVVACGGSTATPGQGSDKAPEDKQIAVMPEVNISEIKTFDPALATDAPSIDSINMVFTGLVQLNDKLEVQGQLAESYQLGPDGVTWTFKLKPDLKFSNGDPLTADDVIYSIDRALQPATKSTTAGIYLGLIKDAEKLQDGKVKTLIGSSLKAPDARTVVIQAGSKAAYFLQTLTYVSSYVVNKKIVEKYGDRWTDHISEGVGAGPFVVSKYNKGAEIIFERNTNYYGDKPQLKKVVYHFYQNADTAYKAYESGQLHTAGVPAPQTDRAKNLKGQFHTEPYLSILFYKINYLAKPFNNIKIRQAFALAINKEQIAHNIYKDTVVPTNHIVPDGQPGYYPDLKGPAGVSTPAGDKEKAKQLFEEGMKEEGYTRANFPPVTLTVASTSASARQEYSAVQNMWKEALGITVKINETEFNKLLTDIDATTNNPNGLQIWRVSWIADYPDPQNWISLQFGEGSENNNVNYAHSSLKFAAEQKELQKKMAQADVTADENQRMKLYNEIEQKLVDDVAWLPIYQGQTVTVRKPCIKGLEDNAQALTPPDDWAKIYITSEQPCANADKYK